MTKTRVKNLLLMPLMVGKLLSALIVYVWRGGTPTYGLLALIHLHGGTNGVSTLWLQRLFRRCRPERPLSGAGRPDDFFRRVSAVQQEQIIGQLRTDGYSLCPLRVPPDICARLRSFAETTPAYPWDAAGKIGAKKLYDRADRQAAKFQFDKADLANQPDIQNLAGDIALLALAQRHLRCFPVLDAITMWWSTPHQERAADEIAQTFHIDYDRVHWLKVFIYLTDVTAESGPHVYVRHSHLREPRRAELVGRGYVRVPDQDIQNVYRQDEIVEICGPAGTILFEDTSGFHKGKLPEKRDRLILELQFSNSLFGSNYDSMPLWEPVGEKLASAVREYPSAYPLFTRQGQT